MKDLHVYINEPAGLEKKTVHRLVSQLRDDLGFSVEDLQISFIDSESIREINISHLGHDYSTDILTFNYGGSTTQLDGEVLISVQDAEENAKRFRVAPRKEMLRLIIHGLLHLTGYDDIEENDRNEMKEREDALVGKYEYLIEG